MHSKEFRCVSIYSPPSFNYRLREEFAEELDNQLSIQRAEFTKQLEETVTQDRFEYDDLHEDTREMEHKLQIVKEELEAANKEVLKALNDSHEKESTQREEQHKSELSLYKDVFAKVRYHSQSPL